MPSASVTDLINTNKNRVQSARQRISDELKVSDCAAYLTNLWLYAAICTRTGVLYGLDATDIAIVAGWEGKPTPFIDVMLNCGVLRVTPCGEYAVSGKCLNDCEEQKGEC